jgi:DNA-binding CsgD family transcriptional regulator
MSANFDPFTLPRYDENTTADKATPRSTMTDRVVRFSVASDDDATRVAAILEALGFSTERVGEEHGPRATAFRLDRLARSRKLSEREREVVESIVAGRTNVEIGLLLDVSRATVKWHLHNVFAKTDVESREELLRLLLDDEVTS